MPSLPQILIIDDEHQIRKLLRLTLDPQGYHIQECENGQQGLSEAALRRPDAIILDLGLPDIHGLEVLKRLREWTQTPVLILSVQGDEEDKIAALDAGADDYLTKPFGGGELIARLKAIMRRVQPAQELSIIRFDDIEVDFTNREVRKDGIPLNLTVKEYSLLRLLLQHRGKVITHRQLLREIWGPCHESDTHYLRVHITHLRQKLGDKDGEKRRIRTESGVGYRFLPDPSQS